jgi:hypothetical protein
MTQGMARRLGWPVAAILSFAFLIGLAVQGERPNSALVEFRPAGFLTEFGPEAAAEVEISTPSAHRKFVRSEGWPVRLDEALRLLRDAGPFRVMSPDEVAGQPPSTYGLAESAMTVRVTSASGQSFVIRFGAPNPLGSGRYVRVEGVAGIPILPAHVAEAWEQMLQ